MAKLKNIIRQLSIEDYERIYTSLMESNAEKSAFLLKFIYEQQYSDEKIMQELNVNHNAYYTLRSRLNQKIEEYLLNQIESPRTDLLRKVANINEIVFTKKRTIAIATLRKLEKELLDYDLSHELMIVYKNLKKLHVNNEDYFNYSQAYNKHVAYMMAVDRVESMVAEYFKKYGNYLFTDSEEGKLKLSLLNKEIFNTCKPYDSHRLEVYQNCVSVFHRLFVEPEDDLLEEDIEPIEDIFDKMEKIFQLYPLDASYYHLTIILEFLRLEYYNHYRLYRKAEKFFEEVNDSVESLLSNYYLFTYPARFLLTKLERHTRLASLSDLYEENQGLFQDFEPEVENIFLYVPYVSYRAISCYYAKKYQEAARWLNKLLDTVNLKKYPYIMVEVKLLLALQYSMLRDEDLLLQLVSSIQRQIRQLGKETCMHAVLFTKLLRATFQSYNDKEAKIQGIMDKLKKTPVWGFRLSQYILLDEDFMERLSEEKAL